MVVAKTVFVYLKKVEIQDVIAVIMNLVIKVNESSLKE